MKINFPLLDEPLAIENATFLVLEDQFTFSTIVKQFYQYTDDGELKLFDRNLKSSERIRSYIVINGCLRIQSQLTCHAQADTC